ncbi:hypothetical protein [Streptomyces sp. CBMA123]|uniref:hypothetical protein n=1 Tax=Streptomyces sp. CBMA123 TaxID=1896313 RepID=UPI0016618CDF|nr:hypothetical protein [Streptomyces sp. CBMA123]MBD0688806.1 hypothetical protein [Streptomyces sp. CBMA123]
MDTTALTRLDPHLETIVLNPRTVGVQARAHSPVRDYAKDGVRIAYVSELLSTVVLVAYVEVDRHGSSPRGLTSWAPDPGKPSRPTVAHRRPAGQAGCGIAFCRTVPRRRRMDFHRFGGATTSC